MVSLVVSLSRCRFTLVDNTCFVDAELERRTYAHEIESTEWRRRIYVDDLLLAIIDSVAKAVLGIILWELI